MFKNVLYLTIKLTALAAVLAYDFLADSVSGLYAAAALAFCCLFLTDFLINRISKKRWTKLVCTFFGMAACIFLGAEKYFPLLIMLLFELADLLNLGKYFYHISLPAALLSALIFSPSAENIVTAMVITVPFIFARVITQKLEHYKELSEQQRKSISQQSEKISELKAYSKTLCETVALEERSRFSARIHDKLGHGISGSIILLEGAKLNMNNNPEQAEKCLGTAIENLRKSVDSIREALREERPQRNIAGIADLKEMLERFSVTYDIGTDLSAQGDTSRITPQIWSCLKENLTEALTNTVKHSDATEFALRISVYNKIIRAEFFDNGSNSADYKKGMGLDAIEERTADCGGNCVVQSGSTGFKVINIFRI